MLVVPQTPHQSVRQGQDLVQMLLDGLLAVAVEFESGAGDDAAIVSKILGFVALVLASVNIFGGFLVTQRMLGMYKKKETKREDA